MLAKGLIEYACRVYSAEYTDLQAGFILYTTYVHMSEQTYHKTVEFEHAKTISELL